jgi:endonuclease/exonuclease/phosphatase family metal-dependent hydrolase
MRIRVVTLNVWALPAPIGEDVEARIRAIGSRLSDLDADVVALQEAWTSDARRTLAVAGRSAGLRHAWQRGVTLGGGGLLVLSRLPVRGARFHHFTLRGQPERLDQGDYYGGKGLVQLRLDTEAGPLTLIDTHLHARYRPDPSHRAYRTGQLVELSAEVRGRSDPVVAMGDFNMVEHEPEYVVLAGLAGLRDVAAELDRRQPTKFADNRYRPKQSEKRIDYLFVRDGMGASVQAVSIRRIFDEPLALGGRQLSYSNHAGLLADLEISPRDGTPLPPPDPRAVELAARLLAQGRAAAQQRRREGRALAGTALGCAGLASLGVRTTRRGLLRSGLQGAGLLALAPVVGFSLLSEVFVPDELRAFDRVTARLGRVHRAARGEKIA